MPKGRPRRWKNWLRATMPANVAAVHHDDAGQRVVLLEDARHFRAERRLLDLHVEERQVEHRDILGR